MNLTLEIGIATLAKQGEELCGDAVEIKKGLDSTVVVLSDGLGSGVKANILATLTSKIASNLLIKGVPLPEVVDTITATLPVCQVRQIAYSTFSIVQIYQDGLTYLTLFDNPLPLMIKGKEIFPVEGQRKEIGGRQILESKMVLREGDCLVLVSDGVTHAGIGALLPLGLGLEGLSRILKGKINFRNNAQVMAEEILEYCEVYSVSEPGDDISVVVLKARKPIKGVLLSGPPLEEERDSEIVRQFFQREGRKVICGGTTANIVARERQAPLRVDYNYDDPTLPPVAYLPGVDLVTEGILTLTRVIEMLEQNKVQIKDKRDGASRLLGWLLECDEIELMVGLRVNSAHLQPELPFHLGLRSSLLQRLRDLLVARGKKVSIIWF